MPDSGGIDFFASCALEISQRINKELVQNGERLHVLWFIYSFLGLASCFPDNVSHDWKCVNMTSSLVCSAYSKHKQKQEAEFVISWGPAVQPYTTMASYECKSAATPREPNTVCAERGLASKIYSEHAKRKSDTYFVHGIFMDIWP